MIQIKRQDGVEEEVYCPCPNRREDSALTMGNLSGHTNRRVIAVNVKPPRPVAAASTIGIKRLPVQLSAGSIPARDIEALDFPPPADAAAR